MLKRLVLNLLNCGQSTRLFRRNLLLKVFDYLLHGTLKDKASSWKLNLFIDVKYAKLAVLLEHLGRLEPLLAGHEFWKFKLLLDQQDHSRE